MTSLPPGSRGSASTNTHADQTEVGVLVHGGRRLPAHRARGPLGDPEHQLGCG